MLSVLMYGPASGEVVCEYLSVHEFRKGWYCVNLCASLSYL